MPEKSTNKPREVSAQARANDDDPVSLLAEASGLPRARIKDAMVKGAVHLTRGKRSRRVRRARTRLHPGDRLRLCYDPDLLARQPPVASELHKWPGCAVWFKPPGLLTQGTDYGDHCSLLRQVTRSGHEQARLVHRLDREAFGLVLVALNRATAADLSRQFANREVEKCYRVVVCGHPEPGVIDQPLDDKPAHSLVVVLDHNPNWSLLEVSIQTGRKHQIRRHLADIGCPVLGDPRYGSNNQHAQGLTLCAWRIGFCKPGVASPVQFELPDELKPAWFNRLP
jgi:tRNA pseudouridine32 synthase/23S rRNA pseudouridine746 synthase